MSIGYWCVRQPWSDALALDEFGPGTLDGNPADGASFDGCAAAAIENAAAAYEKRTPSYTNIGTLRREMIDAGQWSAGASVSNPRTSGAYISNVAWAIAHLANGAYVLGAFHDYDAAGLTDADLRTAIGQGPAASIWLVTNAQALVYNEQGVHGHFIVIAGYGGDNPDGSTGKLYILNSDVSGQHGTGTGQWTDPRTFFAAQPCGYAVMTPKPAPVAPPEAPEDENVQAALAALAQVQAQQKQQDAELATVAASLTEPAGS